MNILWIYDDICAIPVVLKLILYIKVIMEYSSIIIPICLIIMTSIDIAKSVIASDEGEMQKNFKIGTKRIFYCMISILIPSIVNLTASLANDSISNLNVSLTKCDINLDNIAYFEKIEEAKKIEEEEKFKQNISINLGSLAKKSIRKGIVVSQNNNSNNNSSSNGSNIAGQKYTLTDAQLKGIAVIAQKEQGTPEGAAAEASLMANRFELYGSKYGSGGNGLYNYVATSDWWGENTSSYMQNTSSLDPDVLARVKEVLVLGKRTLPLYIDEHDCISCGSYGFDIINIVTDGKSITDSTGLLNRSNYKKDNTIIYNRYDSTYTFYSFPTETSDPFGYTENAKNKRSS